VSAFANALQTVVAIHGRSRRIEPLPVVRDYHFQGCVRKAKDGADQVGSPVLHRIKQSLSRDHHQLVRGLLRQ